MDRNAYLARRMHTPDDPVRAGQRALLREVSKLLIPLHRSLIDTAKADFAAATNAPIPPPGLLMRLLHDDPFFAWLKPITGLIVDIDEMVRVDFETSDVDAIAGRLERLFGASSDADFAARYVPMLQRDIDVAVGHAALRKAMARLNPPA